MKKIGIIGHGYVGERMVDFFNGKYELFVYDPKLTFGDGSPTVHYDNDFARMKQMAGKLDLAVICVPTPQNKDGSANFVAVVESISLLSDFCELMLIKSTVPPSITQSIIDKEKLRVVFSPEYLGESAYTTHYWKGYPDPTNLKTHEFQIFGGRPEDTREVIGYFKSIMGPETRYLQTDATTAELAKYMENAFFATKVTFCNEFFEIAKRFGVDYNELRELWLNDGRINRNHTLVFEDKRGYGGKCYPKDVAAIIHAAREVGYDPKLLKEVVESNRFFNTRSQ